MNNQLDALDIMSDTENSDASTSVNVPHSNTSDQESTEEVRILKETFSIPKELCENETIFNEFFSAATWNMLPHQHQEKLKELLPIFPENDEYEKTITLNQFFNNELTRFNDPPLAKFQRDLEEGNYRPDIVRLKETIRKSEARERRYLEQERISHLAQSLLVSRKNLLHAAYNSSPNSIYRIDRTLNQIPKLPQSSTALRTKRRYFQELSQISDQTGLAAPVSDDENYPDGPPIQLTKKQKRQLSGTQVGNTSPGSEILIHSTTAPKGNNVDHLLGPGGLMPLNDEYYKRLLLQHRKRKLKEPENPDFDTTGINVTDILARAEFTSHQRKSTYTKQSSTSSAKKSKIKNELNNTLNDPVNDSLQLALPSSDNYDLDISNSGGVKVKQILTSTSNSIRSSVSEDDSKVKLETVDMTKMNLLNNSSKGNATMCNINGVLTSTNSTSDSDLYSSFLGDYNNETVINRTPHSSDSSERITLPPPFYKSTSVKREVLDSLSNPFSTVDLKPTLTDIDDMEMMHLPVDLDESGTIDIMSDLPSNNTMIDSPTIKLEHLKGSHACFLSLIRDLFCATPDHRMFRYALYEKVNQWLENPLVDQNEWFYQVANWSAILPSAVNFLAGEFSNPPDDYVPYIEFKPNLNIYQWIGAGRDSDARLLIWCSYWLAHRNEKESKPTKKDPERVVKAKISNKTETEQIINPERLLSPPPPRYRTDWIVRPAKKDEIEQFRVQERQRFENPHLAFTYRMYGYESVVGPVKGIYTQIPALSKARGHNMLRVDRPKFVTILTLVRDATARLPNGEGTRADICELLKSSQYISPDATESILQTIVSGALDRMHMEHDPCVRYDGKKKIWIYLHRNRTEEEFERMHQESQGVTKFKKQVTRKPTKPKSGRYSEESQVSPKTDIRITSPQHSIMIQNTQQKAISVGNAPLPALTSIQNHTIIHSANPPPLLNKITSPAQPKTFVKADLVPIIQSSNTINKSELIEIESKVDNQKPSVLITKSQQNMPCLIMDNKLQTTTKSTFTKPPLKSFIHSTTTPVKVSTPSGIQTVHVSTATSSPLINKQLGSLLTGNQSILATNRSNSPVIQKKMLKSVSIVGQSQAPPLISQSSPTSYTILPFNVPTSSSSNSADLNKIMTSMSPTLVVTSTSGSAQRIIKTSTPPALASTNAPKPTSLLQNPMNKTIIRTANASIVSGSKGIMQQGIQSNPNQQQKIFTLSPSGANIVTAVKQQGVRTLVGTSMSNAIIKGPSGTTTTNLSPAQQKQIIQNIFAKQPGKSQRPISYQMQGNVLVATTPTSTTTGIMQVQPKTNILQQTHQGAQQKTKIIGNQSMNQITHIMTTPTGGSGTQQILSPQIIQIQPTNAAGQQIGKIQTVSTSNLTMAQQQSLLASLKQQQQANRATIKTTLASPRHTKTTLDQSKTVVTTTALTSNQKITTQSGQKLTRIFQHQTPSLISSQQGSVDTNQTNAPVVAKILTNSSGQVISLENLLQKPGIAPGTTIRVAGAKPGQTNLIQLSGSTGSPLTQYAVVSQGARGNVIQLTSPQRIISTQANSNVTVVSGPSSSSSDVPKTQSIIITNSGTSQSNTNQTSKIVQSSGVQSINAQQLINAKVLGLQNLTQNKLKPGTVRMVNASNVNLSQLAGKPVIIASKSGNTQQQSNQGLILQNTNQGGNNASIVIGGQALKVHGNILTPLSYNQNDGQRHTMLLSNQMLKVQQSNQSTIVSMPSNIQIATSNVVTTSANSSGTVTTVAASMSTGTSTTKSSPSVTTIQTPIKVQTHNTGNNANQSVLLGTSIKGATKGGLAQATGQQRIVLAVQGGGQIILPPGFQGGAINIKTLQSGLKVIPIQQQQNKDGQVITQIITPQTGRQQNQSGNNTVNSNTSNAN